MGEIIREQEKCFLIIKFMFLMILSYIAFERCVHIAYVVGFVLISTILNICFYMTSQRTKIFIMIINVIISLIFASVFFKEVIFIALFYMIEIFIDKKIIMYLYFIVTIIAVYKLHTVDFVVYYGISFIIFYEFYRFNNIVKGTYIKENRNAVERERELAYLRKNAELRREHEIQNIYTMKLEERNILSKKLHDKVGHTIAGSLLQLEAAKLILNKDEQKSVHMINDVIAILREGMEDIRNLLREFRPCEEEVGLNKIRLILNEKVRNTSMSFSLQHKGNMEKINIHQWIVITDAIREASTNTLKYSHGSRLDIKIEVLNKLIRVEIKDNGEGCHEIVKGIGLKGIEESVINIGGKLVIDGSEGFSMSILLYCS